LKQSSECAKESWKRGEREGDSVEKRKARDVRWFPPLLVEKRRGKGKGGKGQLFSCDIRHNEKDGGNLHVPVRVVDGVHGDTTSLGPVRKGEKSVSSFLSSLLRRLKRRLRLRALRSPPEGQGKADAPVVLLGLGLVESTTSLEHGLVDTSTTCEERVTGEGVVSALKVAVVRKGGEGGKGAGGRD
jgi:hypothetical protein